MYVVGATVPVGSVEELAAGLLEMLALEADAAWELRQAALEKAQTYSWERLIERRLHYYRQM
jgi:glycosyltransferase involved in cell wall biosynthesis